MAATSKLWDGAEKKLRSVASDLLQLNSRFYEEGTARTDERKESPWVGLAYRFDLGASLSVLGSLKPVSFDVSYYERDSPLMQVLMGFSAVVKDLKAKKGERFRAGLQYHMFPIFNCGTQEINDEGIFQGNSRGTAGVITASLGYAPEGDFENWDRNVTDVNRFAADIIKAGIAMKENPFMVRSNYRFLGYDRAETKEGMSPGDIRRMLTFVRRNA